MYVTVRSRMSLIIHVDLIGSEQSELCALEFDFVNTLASANVDQSALNLITIYDGRI